ncbi:MAG TPA: N-acetylneuraminate synthase family protein [Alphaproteobacteria bacterium]|nr:N-acetylneuraminate synthase family protein [Alphaproteobacteria bacterium]
MPVKFIAEVSSNHACDLNRMKRFIAASAEAGADAVKFQLFKIDELFAPEILTRSKEHRARKEWELPVKFLPDLARACGEHGLAFSCTPFYLKAVAELEPYVDFYKIASYELLWTDLLKEVGATGKPVVLSTGMATMPEVRAAVEALDSVGARDITLLHCVSAYPAPLDQCNLAAIETMHSATGLPVGWSDHTHEPAVIERAVSRWGATTVEFHIDLDGEGAEFRSGHCWLPKEIAPVIERLRKGELADGRYMKAPSDAELPDRMWRADPSDGLRPLKQIREQWAKERAAG